MQLQSLGEYTCYNKLMRNYFLGIVTILTLTAIIGGAYYFGMQKSPPSSQNTQTVPTVMEKSSTTTAPSPTTKVKPKVDVSEQIIAAITSKNTQALEGYMADIVQVRLESSSCCGPITSAEAASQLSYLDPAVGWSFDPTNPTLIDLATAVPDYYGVGWIVGVGVVWHRS